jgi:hypothetical protein
MEGHVLHPDDRAVGRGHDESLELISALGRLSIVQQLLLSLDQLFLFFASKLTPFSGSQLFLWGLQKIKID